jgi:energy-coupling factor transport system ATP-binding protein
VIRFDSVTVTYQGAPEPVLRDVSFQVGEGRLCLVVGPTGCGKSTLLRSVNGLVPRFTGGRLEGRVTVAGRDTAAHPPRELADIVGVVLQSPAAGFVADTVEDELAYTMENLGIAPAVMRRRVEEVLDLLGLADLRRQPLASLSSGQQQRVAIGAVLTATPRVLVLDEPTSALDPGAAEEVLAAVTRLVHDLGITALVAEHRLERVVQYADQVVVLEGGRARSGTPAEAMATSPVVPPVVELGRLIGWTPVPLSIRDARREAAALRDRLGSAPRPPASAIRGSAPVARVAGLVARYGPVTALDGVDVVVEPGDVVAVMGRNGSGKSTLLAHMAGLRAPASGSVRVGGDEPHVLEARDLVRRVALVPADPGSLLYASSVAEECDQADRDARMAPGTTLRWVERVVHGLDVGSHPRDLSEGQRLALALGVVLAPEPSLVLLDEPTRGLDYEAKRRLVGLLRRLASQGRGVVLATHDVELVADVATRVLVLADGDVVTDGGAREVLAASPMFAPQVAKVLSPSQWLTVSEVAAALA